MKNKLSLLLISICFLTSCLNKKINQSSYEKHNSQLIEFEDKTFKLPMTEKEARKNFNLDEFGRNGHIDDSKYRVHKKDEETVIGITFYKRQYKETVEKELIRSENDREKIIALLEKKYETNFEALNIKNKFFINPNFVYTRLEDGTIIIVGSLFYNLMYNTYTTISFFNSKVSENEFPQYLNSIY